MRRAGNIILNNLAYGPSPRYSRLQAPADDYPTRIASCIAIASVFGAIFWVYALLFHGDEIWTPELSTRAVAERSDGVGLIAPIAPAPDMRAPGIEFANSDVPSSVRESPVGSIGLSAQRKPKTVAAVKPRPRVRGPLPAEAANAYAAERQYSRPEIGAE
jgi:hypothetical protein